MTLEEEVVQLRAELAEARALIARLQEELDRLRSERSDPPPFVKPNTPRSNNRGNKQPRRKRAKDQNGARRRDTPRRDTPTQTIQHKLEECPTCAYPLRHARLADQRRVIELPPPRPVEITEHQLFKSWCSVLQVALRLS